MAAAGDARSIVFASNVVRHKADETQLPDGNKLTLAIDRPG
jgi:hypothetical protein